MQGWDDYEVWRQRREALHREAELRRLARLQPRSERREGWRVSLGGWVLTLQRAPRCAGVVSRQRDAGLW